MGSKPGKDGKESGKTVFHRVGPNLYRLETSGGYYALLKRGDKQFRRSLKTGDRKLAERRLADLKAKVGQLSISAEAGQTFKELSSRWMAATSHGLKAATITRRKTCIKNLTPYFDRLKVRSIRPHHCEHWASARSPKIAPQTMAHELNVMKAVFEYGCSVGVLFQNPADSIKRRKVIRKPITVPSREQFRALIQAIRQSDGREDSQLKAAAGADLVELLAFSGCRIHEAVSLTWADVDFEKNTLTITGGDRGTKSHEHRTIPMTTALGDLLQRILTNRDPEPTDRISLHHTARRCLTTACERLNFPLFTHHDFRHFFATSCIESGVDIPTLSRWLGHRDGGALAMRVYGHLRQEHSLAVVKRVEF